MIIIAAAPPPKIALSDDEQRIFGFLMDIVSWNFGGNMPALRVAGGWTRDKLMGQESDDIDVAVEGMTGSQMKDAIDAYAAGYQSANGAAHPALGKHYVVRANPEKSKHLETVAVEVYGNKIDFVNLRSETYGDTRVPEMRMGTPEEDALRRDLTINSLYYNINSGQVEDLTSKGLDDLRTMTLRTPMDPKKTFMDDPLRMLRVLRFYSRYPNSALDPNIPGAMLDPEVREAYRTKVSPERAGPEIMKMMSGAKPAEALRVMFGTGLDKAVFDVDETRNLKDLRMDQRNKNHVYDLLEHTIRVVENMDALSRQENLPDETRTRLNLAALFHDYGKAHPDIGKPKASDPSQQTYHGHEEKSVEIADAILRRIGLGKDDRDFVSKIIDMHMRPHEDRWGPQAMGKFVRDTAIPGQDVPDMWRYVLLHGMADEMSKGTPDMEAGMSLKRQHVDQFREYLSRRPPVKPILDGRDIMAMFPTLRPETGFIKEVQQRLLAEQDAGNVLTKDQATTMLEGMRQDIETKYFQKN